MMRFGSKIRRTSLTVTATQNGAHPLLPKSGEASMPTALAAVVTLEILPSAFRFV